MVHRRIGRSINEGGGFAQSGTGHLPDGGACPGRVRRSARDGHAPKPDASRLGTDWRNRIPALLSGLSAAWNEHSAWEGNTKVGGLEMPGEAAGIVALDEVILHSWDLAVASGQRYEPPADLTERLVPFLEHMAEPAMNPAREGLFGPVVPIDDRAPLFERVLALAGRRPDWRAS